MEATKILQSSMLDILFDNRNKAYGAYALRKNYYNRILIASAITVFIAAVFSLITLHSSKKISSTAKLYGPEVTLNKFKEEKKTEKKKTEIPVTKKAEAPKKISSIKLTTPHVTHDNLVTETPPKQLDKLTIGAVTQKGATSNGSLVAPPEVLGVGGKGLKLGNSDDGGMRKDGIFYIVQVEAKFPGGAEAWRKFLETNLRQNIPTDNGAPAGFYTITVSFIVSANGTISEVKVADAPNPDYGTAAEAVRVIERGPRWIPAIQNGVSVPYRQKQKIIFQVQQD